MAGELLPRVLVANAACFIAYSPFARADIRFVNDRGDVGRLATRQGSSTTWEVELSIAGDLGDETIQVYTTTDGGDSIAFIHCYVGAGTRLIVAVAPDPMVQHARVLWLGDVDQTGGGALRLTIDIQGPLGVLGAPPHTNHVTIDDSTHLIVGGDILSDITARGTLPLVQASGKVLGNVVSTSGQIIELDAGNDIGERGSDHNPMISCNGNVRRITASNIFASVNTRASGGPGNLQRLEAVSGDFVGSLSTSQLSASFSGPTGVFVAGALDADITVGAHVFLPIQAASLAAGRTISIGGQLLDDANTDGRISLGANGLHGQIVINAAGGAAQWRGGISIDGTTLIGVPSPLYTQRSSDLGGGAIGVVGYGLYDSDCAPINNSPSPILIAGCSTFDPILVRWYGPVLQGTSQPVSIQMDDGAGNWLDASAMFSVEVNPAGAPAAARSIRIQASGHPIPLPGAYRVVQSAGGLLCGGTQGGAVREVAPFTYAFTLVADCNGNGLADPQEILQASQAGRSLDCNHNGCLDYCDIVTGFSRDDNGDGVPDECGPQGCRADWDQDGVLAPADIALFVQRWATDVNESNSDLWLADFDINNRIEPADIALFVSVWFAELTAGC